MNAIGEVAEALREAALVRVAVLHAFKPGDVIVLECARPFSADQMARMRVGIQQILDRTGVDVLIIPEGLRVVAREEFTTVEPPR